MSQFGCGMLVVSALLSATAFADTGLSESGYKKLDRMVELMGVEQMVVEYGRQCMATNREAPGSPGDYAAKGKPYYGISPSSPEWPTVLEAYETYIRAICAYLDPNEVKKAYRDFYASRLEESDIDAWLELFGTKSGRRLLSVIQEQPRYFLDYYHSQYKKTADSAYDDYMKALEEISSRSMRYEPWWKFW